jgi:GNAT superfamily N-acetyltransferase
MSSLRVRSLFGAEAGAVIDDVARLRIEVFREFPYLYDGTVEAEREYLRGYLTSAENLVVVADEGGHVVGVSTAMPLALHSDAVVPPLEAAGFPKETVYYFGESVLDARYRGRGLGHAFFDHREAAAARFGYRTTSFCAVVRPDDHPARPSGYVPHDAFWSKRGYRKRPDVVCSFGWKELGEAAETPHDMVFWIRSAS